MISRPIAPVQTGSAPAPPRSVAALAAAPTLVGPAPEQFSAALAARRVPIDMDLPGEASPARFGHLMDPVKSRRFRRGLSRSLAAAMVVVITLGGLVFSQTYLKMNQVFNGGTETAAALQTDVKPELLKGEGRGRVNILLLGRGGGDHDAPDLTDTMLIASIDPVNKTASLLSVPRDLWVNVPGQGVMKINAAWQKGVSSYLGKLTPGTTDKKAIAAGFETVDKTVEEIFGLTIDYNVLVNFQAFQQAIDTVGGVTVNVPADLVDPTMAWENANNPVLAKAGIQQFDGKHALIYSRSRETSSDFARAERQRAVLVGLKSKVASMSTLSNPVKIAGLFSSFGNNIQTDLSMNNAKRLYSIVKGVNDSKVSSIGLASQGAQLVTTGNMNGQSIVLPRAGLFKYEEIQQYVRGQLKDPYILKEKATISVLNGTLIPGLATKKADELKSYGYNVVNVSNAPSTGWITTTLVDVTHKKKYTKNYLEQRLNTMAVDQLTDPSIKTNGADFVIIIGTNEASTPVN